MRNFTGAFADGAVLLPLLALLAVQTGFDGAILLATAGLAYVIAGFVYKIPMSVQPLKSVAIAAIAMGASMEEVRLSAFAVGVVCLLLSFFPANKMAEKIPRRLIHGLQLGLGVVLMLKGIDALMLNPTTIYIAIFILLTLAIIFISELSTLPVLGWVATLALGVAFFAEPITTTQVVSHEGIRIEILFALILPQIALTLTNSVVGTVDVSKRYFKEKAKRVTAVSLLRSIGLGNILFSAIGGLPFCHGSGGITAHVKGGSNHWVSNLIIGGTLLALGFAVYITGTFFLYYPAILTAVLLFAVGYFHLKLAKPSWAVNNYRYQLIAMAIVAFVTKNMLWVLLTGIVFEACYLTIRKVSKHELSF
jgi:sulfate permease, SulP family